MAVVLDASAVLAVILAEEGAEYVLKHMSDPHLVAVNLSEAIGILIQYGVPVENARKQIGRLDSTVHNFDSDLAEKTAVLRGLTKEFGLSLADRACLSLGQSLELPVLTSDRRMVDAKSVLGMDIRMIR